MVFARPKGSAGHAYETFKKGGWSLHLNDHGRSPNKILVQSSGPLLGSDGLPGSAMSPSHAIDHQRLTRLVRNKVNKRATEPGQEKVIDGP